MIHHIFREVGLKSQPIIDEIFCSPYQLYGDILKDIRLFQNWPDQITQI